MANVLSLKEVGEFLVTLEALLKDSTFKVEAVLSIAQKVAELSEKLKQTNNGNSLEWKNSVSLNILNANTFKEQCDQYASKVITLIKQNKDSHSLTDINLALIEKLEKLIASKFTSGAEFDNLLKETISSSIEHALISLVKLLYMISNRIHTDLFAQIMPPALSSSPPFSASAFLSTPFVFSPGTTQIPGQSYTSPTGLRHTLMPSCKPTTVVLTSFLQSTIEKTEDNVVNTTEAARREGELNNSNDALKRGASKSLSRGESSKKLREDTPHNQNNEQGHTDENNSSSFNNTSSGPGL